MSFTETPLGVQGSIDPAALAAATIAAAVTVIGPAGPYSAGGMVIGLVVLAVIYGFDREQTRTFRQSVGYSAAITLVAWLVFAFPLEILCSGWYGAGKLEGWDAACARLGTLLHEKNFYFANGEHLDHSSIPPLLHLSASLLTFALVLSHDMWQSFANSMRLLSVPRPSVWSDA